MKQLIDAANRGDVEAQYELGACYADGDGVPQNFKEAVKWMTLAAEQNHAAAQGVLGGWYVQGFVAPRDFKLAYMWLSISLSHISKDFEYIKEIRQLFIEVKSHMTDSEIVDAQQIAEEWVERCP